MPTIITIANQKGGVGKTTTAVTLASGFAALGKRVLLIDTDVQGNVAHFLGLEPADDLFQVLMNDQSIAEIAVQVPNLHYLYVVRSFRKTAAIEATFSASADIMGWTKANLLSDPLAQVDDYDLVFIDTAPALSSIQEAALYASDHLIIPAIPEYASEAGIAQLAATVRDLDARVTLLGVLPTMVDSRSREHADTIAEIEEAFPELVLPKIRRLIALGEAPRAGVPVWWYGPNSEATKDFAAVLSEVETRVL